MSDESIYENYINNLLTLVIWKFVYDQIVYIVKKRYQYFFKEFLGGGTKNKCPPMLSYAPALLAKMAIPDSQ